MRVVQDRALAGAHVHVLSYGSIGAEQYVIPLTRVWNPRCRSMSLDASAERISRI